MEAVDRNLMEELGLMATESQLNYIDLLLDRAYATLSEYTDTPFRDLTKEEASDIIDELKGDLGYD